jgi:K+ transporter
MYFGPITMVWFAVIGGLGILSLVLNHEVLGQIMWAFNPLEGLHLLITHPGQVKTIGCVLVKVNAEGISTRLVYIGDDNAAHVADEHAALALPAR